MSELPKGHRADPAVRGWVAGVPDGDLFTSVLVLGEIRRGIELIRRRDVPSALALEQWLARLSESFSDRVLGIDARGADRWGALNVPDPLPTVDGLLVATALVHEMTLVTRNARDIAATGGTVLDPFLV